jgi:hypothetical protein
MNRILGVGFLLFLQSACTLNVPLRTVVETSVLEVHAISKGEDGRERFLTVDQSLFVEPRPNANVFRVYFDHDIEEPAMEFHGCTLMGGGSSPTPIAFVSTKEAADPERVSVYYEVRANANVLDITFMRANSDGSKPTESELLVRPAIERSLPDVSAFSFEILTQDQQKRFSLGTVRFFKYWGYFPTAPVEVPNQAPYFYMTNFLVDPFVSLVVANENTEDNSIELRADMDGSNGFNNFDIDPFVGLIIGRSRPALPVNLDPYTCRFK